MTNPADPEIWLDLSRLMSRAGRGALTGIDRVELAYASRLAEIAPERLRYVAFDAFGRHVEMSRRSAGDFVGRVREVWDNGGGGLRRAAAGLAAVSLASGAPPRIAEGACASYVLVSHHHLDRERAIGSFLARSGAAFVPLVHDLIPIEYPEYARPGEADRHLARMATVSRHADAIVANSAHTAEALRPYLPKDVPVSIAPLGVARQVPQGECKPPSARPYFVCVGTIEPRKNHLLLLHLWRRFAGLENAPRLVLVGRRGWENEQVVDLLERSSAIRSLVDERSCLPDAEVAGLVRGARAVLMPSFAEGYGLPVAEALSLGTPVLCSDIPALREVGGIAPEYLDPLDSVSWARAIVDYAAPGSPRRSAAVVRAASWAAPTWEDHVAVALELAEAAARRKAARQLRSGNVPGGQLLAQPITFPVAG
jgi:glycosyltransferase involved in cell wall biosynthesis